jgi:hypothetical protein
MWHAWSRIKIYAGFWLEDLKERDHSEDMFIDRRIVLKWILSSRTGQNGLDSCGSGQRQVADPCVHGHAPSGSIKCREFLDSRRTLVLVVG